jgi:predicted protein tyrosine phosphatase
VTGTDFEIERPLLARINAQIRSDRGAPFLSRLKVLSRRLAMTHESTTRYAVISIHDPPPEVESAKIPQRWGLEGILRLGFHDVDPQTHMSHRGMESLAMRSEQAREVWRFVRDKWLKVECLVIHCEAGVSRSPSVAMAIADAFAMGRDVIDWRDFDPSLDPPNWHVYDTMMRAWRIK